MLAAVLESYRRFRSLETWGRMLQWDGWPKEWVSSHETAGGASRQHVPSSKLSTRSMKWMFDSEVDRDDVDAQAEQDHPNDVAMGSKRVHLRPMINAAVARDLWAWLTGHTMLREFGAQFWHRIALYMSMFIGIVIVMSIATIASVMIQEADEMDLQVGCP